jgi:hypothetical protein
VLGQSLLEQRKGGRGDKFSPSSSSPSSFPMTKNH